MPDNSVSFNSQRLINLGTPTLNADAVTKLYVDTSDNLRLLSSTSLNNITLATGSLNMNT